MARFHTISFPNDPVTYLVPDWNDMNELAFEVSNQIREQGQEFNRIVTLAKGGWPMTRSLVDFLSIPKVASIGVKFYSDIGEHLAAPKIYQDIPVSVKGETVLLFDDVADSGESLIFTKNYLKQKGVKKIKTATLFYKPHSKLKPDYFAAQTSAWIVFPFEPFEIMKQLTRKWSEQGLSPDEIELRFKQMKFAPDFIELISIE